MRAGAATDQKSFELINYATTGDFALRTGNDAYTVSAEAMHVTRGSGYAISNVNFPSGNVGVGTASPAGTLDLLGGVNGWPSNSGTIQTGMTARMGRSGGVLDLGMNGASGGWLQMTNRGDLSQVYPLNLNPNGGFVGIGTTTPSYPLTVTATAGIGISYTKTGSKDARITVSDPTKAWSFASGWATAGEFSILQEGAGDRLHITNTGNVGIGTTSPTAQMHVYGANQTTAAINTAGTLGGSLLLQDSGGASGNGGSIVFGILQGNFAAIKGFGQNGSNNTQGEIAFSTRNAATDTALTERMRILANGNVGIGSSTPGAALDIVGNVKISGTIAQPGWTAVTYTNGWSDYGLQWAPVAYFKDKNNIVHLRGLAAGGTCGNGIFTLPAGYRPAYQLLFTTMAASALARPRCHSGGSRPYECKPVQQFVVQSRRNHFPR